MNQVFYERLINLRLREWNILGTVLWTLLLVLNFRSECPWMNFNTISFLNLFGCERRESRFFCGGKSGGKLRTVKLDTYVLIFRYFMLSHEISLLKINSYAFRQFKKDSSSFKTPLKVGWNVWDDSKNCKRILAVQLIK